MAKCAICGKEEPLSFKCHHCGQRFCSDHRLPEDHNCYAFDRTKNKFIKNWKYYGGKMMWMNAKLFGNSKKNPDKNNKKYSMNDKIDNNKKIKRKFFSWVNYVNNYLHKTMFKQLLFFIISFFAIGFLINGYFANNFILAIIFFGIDLYLIKKLLHKRARPTKILIILIVFCLAFASAQNFSQPIFNKVGVTSFFDGNFFDNNIFFYSLNNQQENNKISDNSILTIISNIGDETGSALNNIKENILSSPDIDKIEQLIYQKTNELRQSKRLNKLTWHASLAKIARAHSLDMGENNFFDHTNLRGDGPTERAEKAGINTKVDYGSYYKIGIGENISQVPIHSSVIGCGSTSSEEAIVECAFNGWVKSPGHYANMIDTDYKEIGVGVAIINNTTYLTQNFR